MKLKVTIEFRDDTKQEFLCNDFPIIGDWITLFFDDFERKMIPKEPVQKISYKFVKT